MSERRKRSVRGSGDSEEFSEGSDDVEVVKASEGENEHDTGVVRGESEYESADSDEERVLQEKPHHSNEEASSDINEDIDDEEELLDEEDEELYGSKREEGDGEESISGKEKKLDDDEDRRNPQYIPKRGTFYEHDDRTAEDQEEEEAKKEEPRKKKVWKENDDCWSHDKFNESDQAPKSRDELVASYGYDIRSEEGPPRARRRRRYGRGPNKYDRNWEDENAYSKLTRGGRGGLRKSIDGLNRGPRSSSGGEDDLEVQNEEEFPALSSDPRPRRGASRGKVVRGRAPREFESTQRQQQKSMDSQMSQKSTPVSTTTPPAPTNQPTRGGRGRGLTMPGVRNPRGGSGRIVEGRGRGRGAASNERHDRKTFSGSRDNGYKDNRREDNQLENEIKNLSLKDNEPVMSRDFRRQTTPKGATSSSSYHQQNERRQANVPPRLQQENTANRPKRYSSQRQRSLPESSNSFDQPGYYEQQGYQQRGVYAETSQPASTQSAAAPVTSTTPTNSPQIHPAPTPAFAPNFPSPPPAAFIPHVQPSPQPPRMFPPTQAAPTFIAPTGSMINYVPTPPAQFAPTYPAFQSYPPVPQPPPPQPAELFVPASGITYYSPQNQVPRHTPLKRPKAAIPILPPPAKDKKQESSQETKDLTELPAMEQVSKDEVPILEHQEQVKPTECIEKTEPKNIETATSELLEESNTPSEVLLDEKTEEKSKSLAVTSDKEVVNLSPLEMDSNDNAEKIPAKDTIEEVHKEEQSEPPATEVSA